MNTLKIKKMVIQGIGGITNLTLPFKDGLNLICGTNGIGKTTILECISHTFIQTSTTKLKKNVNAQKGTCTLFLVENNTEKEISYDLTHFNPTGTTDYISKLPNQSQNILFFNAQRSFEYQNLSNISRDPDKGHHQTATDAYTGISATGIKSWFIQRYMWSAHKDALKPEQLHNLNAGKDSFNVLDSTIHFSRVIPDTNDIMVYTRQGEIYFEYLSSGYKSCIYILLGIIKEIEFRFKSPCIKVQDFTGIILIDEIDVHLHPQWQENLIKALKQLLPKAQIIASTHSPSMIQCATTNEIIPLRFDDNNNIVVQELAVNNYGFQGWTIEEILTDVMGMTSVHSKLFSETLTKFDKSIDNDNIDDARHYYKELNLMLHPSNPLRKMLEIEMIGVDSND